jgi:hypothetical protein
MAAYAVKDTNSEGGKYMPLMDGYKPCDVCGAVPIKTEKTERPLICSECWDELEAEQPGGGGVKEFKAWWSDLMNEKSVESH